MKASEEGTREWRRGVRHGDVWEKIAGDRRNNRCKGTEVRTNLVCLWNKMKASVESGRRGDMQSHIR